MWKPSKYLPLGHPVFMADDITYQEVRIVAGKTPPPRRARRVISSLIYSKEMDLLKHGDIGYFVVYPKGDLPTDHHRIQVAVHRQARIAGTKVSTKTVTDAEGNTGICVTLSEKARTYREAMERLHGTDDQTED